MHNPIQEIALGHVATAQPLTNTGPASHHGTAPSAVSISARISDHRSSPSHHLEQSSRLVGRWVGGWVGG